MEREGGEGPMKVGEGQSEKTEESEEKEQMKERKEKGEGMNRGKE